MNTFTGKRRVVIRKHKSTEDAKLDAYNRGKKQGKLEAELANSNVIPSQSDLGHHYAPQYSKEFVYYGYNLRSVVYISTTNRDITFLVDLNRQYGPVSPVSKVKTYNYSVRVGHAMLLTTESYCRTVLIPIIHELQPIANTEFLIRRLPSSINHPARD